MSLSDYHTWFSYVKRVDSVQKRQFDFLCEQCQIRSPGYKGLHLSHVLELSPEQLDRLGYNTKCASHIGIRATSYKSGTRRFLCYYRMLSISMPIYVVTP